MALGMVQLNPKTAIYLPRISAGESLATTACPVGETSISAMVIMTIATIKSQKADT